MTLIFLFDSILTCGDAMLEKQREKEMYVKIKKLYIDKKYNSFIKESTKYLDIVPNDIGVRFMRARSYRKLNMFNEAIEDLKHILNLDYSDYALLELYFIYYHLNRYEEALELLPLVYERKPINSYSVSISELVMKKHLGMDVDFKKGARCDYIRGQIVDYNFEDAIEHTKKHINKTDDPKISYFNEGINLQYLFDLIINNLNNSKKVNADEVLEIHYFGLGNIGVFNNQNCNFLKVVVVPNTTHIISLYPTNNVDYNYVLNIECDYEKLFSNNKVKTKSRIDRFNKKYNL